jgi:hypothetical protein
MAVAAVFLGIIQCYKGVVLSESYALREQSCMDAINTDNERNHTDDSPLIFPTCIFSLGQMGATAFAILFSAGIVGTAVLIRAKYWKMYSRLQPGHWLLLMSTLALLLCFGIVEIGRRLRVISITDSHFFVILIAVPVMYFLAFCISARKLNTTRFWKKLFRIFVCLHGGIVLFVIGLSLRLFSTGYISQAATGLFMILCMVGIATAVIYGLGVLFFAMRADRKPPVARDWLHWLGLLNYGAVAVVILLSLYELTISM